MSNLSRAAAASLLVLCISIAPVLGSEAPTGGEGTVEGAEPRIWVEEDRRVLIEDVQNRYRLTLPAPYWECRTRTQLAAEVRGQGCTRGGGVPTGFLLLAHNKDALAWVSLQIVPQRFLLRNKSDLANYLNASWERVSQQGWEPLEADEAPYSEVGGLISPRARFARSVGGDRMVRLIVQYFTRPKDQDLRIYNMECVTTEQEFERHSKDLEQIIASFRYTGELSAAFYVPEAPNERLPDLSKLAQPQPACGGGQSGILVAVLVVLFVYTLMRRRRSQLNV